MLSLKEFRLADIPGNTVFRQQVVTSVSTMPNCGLDHSYNLGSHALLSELSVMLQH